MAQVQQVAELLPQTLGSKSAGNVTRGSQLVCNDLQRRMEAIRCRYGSREHFLQVMNPSLQSLVAANPDRCYFGDAPTLTMLNNTYGKNTAVIWLMPQIHAISEFCGCKDKITDSIAEELAKTIQTEWYYLKTSEFLLYFHRFRTGKYGKFYGSVDPLTITSAIWQFLEERKLAYTKHQQEEERKQREAWEKEERMTYEEYKQLKEQKK